MRTIRYTEAIPPADFLALGQRVWPGSYGLDDVSRALANTTNIGAWDGDALVGSVRVLTDGYFLATVPEILVDPSYRRHGIGRELMRRALDRAPRGKLFFGAQPDAVAFFDRIGCIRRLTGFFAVREQSPPAPANDR